MARQVSSRMQECPPSDTAQEVAGVDNIDNYQVGDLLGRGGFASVYKATCINTGMEVAIKMVDKQQMFRYENEIIMLSWLTTVTVI